MDSISIDLNNLLKDVILVILLFFFFLYLCKKGSFVKSEPHKRIF